jgi:hypothetical protein
MTTAVIPVQRSLTLENMRGSFLAILPRLERHGRIYFRDLDPGNREEAVCELVALAWAWFVRLAEKGRDASHFPSTLATFAGKAVRSGRRLCGQERAEDVLSPRARWRHGFAVGPLPDESGEDSVFVEALHDNTITPVVDQVQFRVDFPAWRSGRSVRDRKIIDGLMVGERTSAVSRKHGLSHGRVSQLRWEFAEDWNRFCEDAPAGMSQAAGAA